jgi:hypothetical protein
MEEALGSTKKIPCGCCLQKFLYINLPLRVSQKAVTDIRIKWSGGLTSQTVFGGVVDDGVDDKKLTKEEKAERLLLNPERLSAIPRCYDQVMVCSFCAQFFYNTQEEYRPSFKKIVYEEKKAVHDEAKRLEKLWWDPLLTMTKYREAEDEMIKAQAEFLAIESVNNSATDSQDINNEGPILPPSPSSSSPAKSPKRRSRSKSRSQNLNTRSTASGTDGSPERSPLKAGGIGAEDDISVAST